MAGKNFKSLTTETVVATRLATAVFLILLNMKNFNFGLFFLIIIVAQSCATNELTISVTEPAPVTLPAHVQTVGVVNRTQSTVNNTLNKMDEIMSLELKGIDSVSARETCKGLTDELQKNTRFTAVKNLSAKPLKNNAIGRFSNELSKSEVISVCNKNNVDAIFVLEYLDTHTKVDYSVVPVKVNLGVTTVDAVETMASVSTNIMLGWRIYDANGMDIYDQFPKTHTTTSSGRGINPMAAISAVTGHKDMIKTESYNQGKEYAWSILPTRHRVSRLYYVKGSPNFKIGKRLARAGKWNEAATYWERETQNPKGKIAGRAYYNMAIINEINGDIDAAIDWSEKSYTLYGNKKALRYLTVLKIRKDKIAELKRQGVN